MYKIREPVLYMFGLGYDDIEYFFKEKMKALLITIK